MERGDPGFLGEKVQGKVNGQLNLHPRITLTFLSLDFSVVAG